MSRGDHLFVHRGRRYTHHAIDCGDGTVIHYIRRGAIRRVERTPWHEFTRGAQVHLRTYRVRLPIEQIVSNAESRLHARGYSLIRNNCEHLASWASTGYARSAQVRRWAVVAPGAVAAAGIADAAGVPLTALWLLGAALLTAVSPLGGPSRRSSSPVLPGVTEPRVGQGA